MDSRLFLVSFLFPGILIFTSCSALQKMPQGKQKTLLVTATAFNSLPAQGQGDPHVGAWGDKITPGIYWTASE